jgi:hypothetical protein
MTLAARFAIPSATGPFEKSFTASLIAGPMLSSLEVVHWMYSKWLRILEIGIK